MGERESLFQGYGESTFETSARFFERLRGWFVGEATAIALTVLLLSDFPFWLRIPESVLPYMSWVGIGLLAIAFGILLFSLRKVAVRSFTLKRSMRIWTSQVVSRLEKEEPVTLKTVARLCSEGSARIFDSYSTGRPRIGSAVRIDVDGLYHTYARAGILNPKREETTKPLYPDGKLLTTLGRDELRGYPVFICNDVDLAQDKKDLEEDENSKLYPNEVKSMMIARLYAWDIEKQCRSQMGLLYITSSERNWFKASQVDVALAIADAFESLALFAIWDEDSEEEM